MAPEAAQNSVPYVGCSVELMSTKAVSQSAGVGARWVGVPEAKGVPNSSDQNALWRQRLQNSVPYGGCFLELTSTQAVSAGVGAHWVGVPEAKGALPSPADM